MRFSVVIINHNYERFLADAIDSVVNQDLPAHEIVVVDDGSTDNSAEVIGRYGEKITPVFKEHAGHTSAFNAGFRASSGDFVIFLDADDILYPECLRTVTEKWRDGLAKIQFRLDTIDESGRNLDSPFPYFAPDLSSAEIRRQALKHGMYPWTVSSGNVFSRKFLEKVMPISERDFVRAPDGYVNQLAPLYGDVLAVDAVLGGYRVHGNNLAAQRSRTQRPGKYGYRLKYDLRMLDEFVRHAERLGMPVEREKLIPSPNHIELRILSYRLDRDRHPLAGDNVRSLFWLGVRSAFASPGKSIFGRSLWCLWFAGLATLPKRWIKTLSAYSRAQAGRGSLPKLLIRLSRPSTR